jgi:hypothetical protein
VRAARVRASRARCFHRALALSPARLRRSSASGRISRRVSETTPTACGRVVSNLTARRAHAPSSGGGPGGSPCRGRCLAARHRGPCRRTSRAALPGHSGVARLPRPLPHTGRTQIGSQDCEARRRRFTMRRKRTNPNRRAPKDCSVRPCPSLR